MTASLSQAMLASLEAELRKSLEALDPDLEPELVRMLRYHFGWTEPRPETGGKRLRPLLTLLACSAADGDWQQALPAAAAVELMHNFTLLHDDIEDRSEIRRGRRTVWVEWGIPQAINTGDALYVMSHLAATRLLSVGVDAATVLRVRDALDRSCLELTRGQHQDIAFEGRRDVSRDEYLRMVEGKTAALLAAAVFVGAILGGADPPRAEAYRSFGFHIGLAFQMLDDILGIWGSADETGKSPGDDLRVRKKTLPVILGLDGSPEFRRRWDEESRDEGAIRAMVRLLEQAGIRSQALERAEGETRLALDALGGAAPAEPAATELASLTARLLHRAT